MFDSDKILNGARGLARYGECFVTVSVSADGLPEELSVLASHNRETFNILSVLANRYLDKCGRRYVDMQGLFGFMEKIRI